MRDEIVNIIDEQIEHSEHEISKLKWKILILSLIILYAL